MMSDVAQLNDFLPGGALAPISGPLVDTRIPLIGLDREGLAKVVADMGEPAFRAKQLYSWMYYRGSSEFSAMTDLSKAFRARLEETCHINRPRVSMHQKSTDGTEKWLLRYEDGNEAEMVFIPEVDRGTLCISSQVGCSLTCTFCHTGTQKLVRNLTPGDIVGQVMLARDSLNDWGKAEDGDRRITNIVLMGMGEPLYNTDNVLAAMRLVADGDGIAISRRRITLSTSGVVPDIKRVGEEMGLSLAVSLHAVRDELRNQIVPINRKYPIAQLMAAVKEYPGLTNSRRVTWEYVMLKGVNDSDADARALLRITEGIPSKMNLIPFNPWPGSDYECSDPDRMQRFLAILHKAGMVATIRKTRGQDILAACGQLKSESERIGKRERDRIAALRAEKEAAVGL
ncbi:23S rRNA (adenine(2503)-C(2))-methyltransferase RlmN [Hwanghaeella sp. 1Z406]|jgi:23S rRNA (adenine2503-C2)-methyltransferase|uniref:23S rRNA (adenine(2503)-C(2))-methyltransferase RlmN n=2 Tax=unclassified Hwanghaeella TaxID=2605944 RepID=UPI003B673089|tara:strand:+ start:200357 stop:201553 length:1197 start_codon:yes stop_codon:yes gene_type:complete